MTLYELVCKSRSYRGYDESRQLTREELLELIECARLCPSSVNRQPLKFYPVWEHEQAERVLALTRWARALPELTLPHPGKHPTAFIIICQDQEIDPSLTRYQKDVGIVAQTMLLAAVEKGLGGCMIGNFDPAPMRAELGLDARYAPLLVVALGKPDETIVLTEVGPEGSTDYYRDADDVHYVPKRSLEDIIL
ncbi:MAG: nitroreductase family protein [Oscillospiraceae bacterium]|nr:nitroreductase family protein [Oscillospiraceae bacterium]